MWPANVKATPVQGDISIPTNAYVWKLDVTQRAVNTLSFVVLLRIDGCHPGGATEAEGSFWPFGRQAVTCSYGYGDPVALAIKSSPLKCKKLN